MKANKQTYIDYILTELEKGNVQYKDVCSVFCGNFQLTERSFVKYWNIANEEYKERLDAIKTKSLVTAIEEEKKTVKSNVLNKVKAMELLTQMAYTSEKDSDKRNAIETLSKMQGWEAPKKVENTNIEVKPLEFTVIKKY